LGRKKIKKSKGTFDEGQSQMRESILLQLRISREQIVSNLKDPDDEILSFELRLVDQMIEEASKVPLMSKSEFEEWMSKLQDEEEGFRPLDPNSFAEAME